MGSLLDGVELTLLDSKLVGLGFVREDLVRQLCERATVGLIRDGEGRATEEISTITNQLTSMVDERCSDLVVEGGQACAQVLGQIQQRFDSVVAEALVQGEEQCTATKKLTVEMVRKGAEQAFIGQRGLGEMLAMTEFRRAVEEQRVRGEQLFQKNLEVQREMGEEEFKRQLEEGRKQGERNFTVLVEEGRVEAEKEYASVIGEEKAKAEGIYNETVAKEREKADKLFNEMVEKGREEAEKQFNDAVAEGREEGEKMCTDMISVACTNVTEGTDSDDFCLDFFFFTSDLDGERRRKRGDSNHLYGDFYTWITS